jgi:large subunit ribosomal protein L17
MMRHGKKIHRLGRPADQRKALLRALTTAVLTHGAIKTTKEKARAVRPWVDKMIMLAKAGGDAKRKQVRLGPRDAESIRAAVDGEVCELLLTHPHAHVTQMHAWLYDKAVVEAIFSEAPERYAERSNDFTKMTLALSRRGDNANMVTLELGACRVRSSCVQPRSDASLTV